MRNEKESCESSDATADLRLIPEFDGVSQPVCEWLDKVELVCQLRGIKGLHVVVPLRLTGGALAVYQQLGESEKKNYEDIKKTLISAFASDRNEVEICTAAIFHSLAAPQPWFLSHGRPQPWKTVDSRPAAGHGQFFMKIN